MHDTMEAKFGATAAEVVDRVLAGRTDNARRRAWTKIGTALCALWPDPHQRQLIAAAVDCELSHRVDDSTPRFLELSTDCRRALDSEVTGPFGGRTWWVRLVCERCQSDSRGRGELGIVSLHRRPAGPGGGLGQIAGYELWLWRERDAGRGAWISLPTAARRAPQRKVVPVCRKCKRAVAVNLPTLVDRVVWARKHVPVPSLPTFALTSGGRFELVTASPGVVPRLGDRRSRIQLPA